MSESTLSSHEDIAVNDRVHLRPLQLADASGFLAAIDNNREYLTQWAPWIEDIKTIEDTVDIIQEWLKRREFLEEYSYGIFVDGEVGGDIGATDKGGGTAEIGCWVSEELAGQGIATEAVIALRDACINLGLKKLEIRANAGNIASQRVAEKAGFIKTGEYVNEEDFRKGETTYVYEYTKHEQADTAG